MHLIFILLTICSIAAATYTPQNDSFTEDLIAVVQVFRHGHRTPIEFYVNDPYANRSYWDNLGLGELTNIGKRQLNELGKFSRKRYDNWLPAAYNNKDFYALTTNVDRTHMSAQTNIYGLYPASGPQIWKDSLDWQPIPIHPADADVFSTAAYSCVDYAKEYVEYVTSKEFLELNEKYTDIFTNLAESTGNNVTDVFGSITIHDCLVCEDIAGLKLPDWTASMYPQPLRNLSSILYRSYSATPKLQRLGIGPWLYDLLQYFDNVIAGEVSEKYRIYSGHDTNIIMILNTFEALDESPYLASFGSSLYFELRGIPGSYYLNVWSKDNDNLRPISIKGCDLDCPLDEVRKRLKNIIVDVATRNAECQEEMVIQAPAQELFDEVYVQHKIDVHHLFIET